MDELPLGRKIYVLREDRALSQTKLEVEAGLSFGTLSRIENGNINPTKETIIKIAQVLDLHDDEFNYLISLQKSSPDEKEIERVVGLVKDDFDRQTVPMYMIDNQFRVWYWNDMILKLFGIDKNIANKHKGLKTWDILFSKDFKVMQGIPKRYLPIILGQMLVTYKSIVHKYRNHPQYSEDFRKLRKSNYMSELWTQEYKKQFLPFSCDFWFNYDGITLVIDVELSTLSVDSRFFVIKYYPKDTRTASILDEIKMGIFKH
jgi:transcriptional regulator with XRE-family HTH domain